jgi:RNA polymerase sigma-70 factor (ECF subfamily)
VKTPEFNEDRLARALHELIKRVAKKEQLALSSLYELTVSRLYSAIYTIVRSAADAEEVLGDVYVQVWTNASSFDPARGSSSPGYTR